ncbi:hypothetical protein F2P81_004962 [Scophthalmus maximus]|uniref:Uncharacterized protein n=1 Tax=Scophthalmus maximus TaxID=52904 RepID=A0A6A4TEK0_SCOMX|nr:hypothetical protein F2P81_004962 [Scophthalmus maximus]
MYTLSGCCCISHVGYTDIDAVILTQVPRTFTGARKFLPLMCERGVSHASQLAADKLAVAMQERFIHSDDTLPISVRWKPHVSAFLRSQSVETDSEAAGAGERGASNQAELKALTVRFQIGGCLTCQFEV